MSHQGDCGEFELIDPAEIARLTLENEESPPNVVKIQGWLQPTDYKAASSEFKRHLASQAPGTGLWIRASSQFQLWHKSPQNGSIWIKGVAGAGKSVVAASMIDTLGSESVPVLHFFFRQIIASHRTARSLVQDWLCQLLPFSQVLQASLWPLAHRDANLSTITTNQLWKFLLTALNSAEKVYCIIDALDEMDIDPEFFSKINMLGSFRPGQIKIVITSRPKQYLQRALRDPAVIHISLEEELVNRDIRTFVQHRVRSLDTAEEIKDSVVEAIVQRSNGLFLYARLMLDDLVAAGPTDLQTLITRLPLRLEEMYNSILIERSISTGVEEKVQVRILQLVTQSARPLRLIEIAKAIEQYDITSQNCKEVVRTACGPLLEVTEDEVVQIMHHSLTEFLLDGCRSGPGHQFPVIDSNQAHHDIALLCLHHLMNGVFESYMPPPTSGDNRHIPGEDQRAGFNFRPVLLRHPFTQYAAERWSYHARLHGGSEQLLQAVTSFSQDKCYAAWVDLCSSSSTRDRASTFTPLHASAKTGLLFWAQHLIENGADVNALDAEEQTPMKWAAEAGHEDIVALLIDSGADPDIDGTNGWKPMHHAARRDHSGVVRLLLQVGVSPTTPRPRQIRGWCGSEPSSVGEHPLMYASRAGNTRTVIEMLPYCKPHEIEEALCWAAECGHFELMTALFDRTDVSPDAKSRTRRDQANTGTALILACEALELRCVELLLNKGADVNKSFTLQQIYASFGGGPKVRNKETALHALAARSGGDQDAWHKIFSAIIDHGADLEAQDGKGRTPLLRLFGSIRLDTLAKIQVLQRANANLYAIDHNGENALFQAVKHHEKDVLDFLLKFIDPSLACPKGWTPLHHAVSGNGISNKVKIMQALVHAGADVNAINENGDTALHLLCRARRLSKKNMMNCLLEAGSNVNIQNKLGRTCLYDFEFDEMADFDDEDDDEDDSDESDDPFGKICKTAQLGQVDNDNYNVLQHSIINNSALTEPLLQFCSQSLLSSQINGKTALHIACQAYNTKPTPATIVQTLLDHGAEISVDDEGNTLLHEMATRFQGSEQEVSLVERLLEFVPMDSRNKRQRTALHIVPTFRPERAYGNLSLVDVFKKHNPHLDVSATDDDGNTPLHLAVSSELETFRLLHHGADVDARNDFLQTPLHLAAQAGSGGVVALLVHFGATSNADANERTPMLEACHAACPEAVGALLAAGSECTPECFAAVKHCRAAAGAGRAAEVLELLTGTNVTLQDSRECFTESACDISALIGSDKDFFNRDKRPLLHTYIENLSASEVQQLLKRGFDFTRAHTWEERWNMHSTETAVGIVATAGRRDLMAKLVSQARLLDDETYRNNVVSGRYRTCVNPVIQDACTRPVRNVEMIGFLIAQGFDVNATPTSASPRELEHHGRTALHVLARGDYWWQAEAIKLLVEAGRYTPANDCSSNILGANLEAIDDNGCSPLHIACTPHEEASYMRPEHTLTVKERTFQDRCCQLLLILGADPNCLDGSKRSPLNLARNKHTIQLLLEHGADVNHGSMGVVMSAIDAHDVDLLKTYLCHGADCNSPDETGFHRPNTNRYPLVRVVNGYEKTNRTWIPEKIREEMLEALLDHGAKLDIQVNNEETMVHHLFTSIEPFALRPLLQRRYFDPSLRDKQGRTVFLAACDSFKKSKDGPTFWLLAKSEHYETDYLATDNMGHNMLMYLSLRWNATIADKVTELVTPQLPQLLAQRNEAGNTALHLALEGQRQEAGLWFLQHGADTLVTNVNGDTVLHICFLKARRGRDWLAPHELLVDTYLGAGGSINTRNNKGQTPLHAYVSSVRDSWPHYGNDPPERDACLDYFAAHGMDFHARDNRGYSALHHIASRQRQTMMPERIERAFFLVLFKDLVARGCDPLLEDNEGRTALDIAAAAGNNQIIESYQRKRA